MNAQSIMNDEWVLRTVSEGLFILTSPVQNSIPASVVISDDKQKVCDAEVEGLLVKGANFKIQDDCPGLHLFFLLRC